MCVFVHRALNIRIQDESVNCIIGGVVLHMC